MYANLEKGNRIKIIFRLIKTMTLVRKWESLGVGRDESPRSKVNIQLKRIPWNTNANSISECFFFR
jgi:hypothetical protein